MKLTQETTENSPMETVRPMMKLLRWTTVLSLVIACSAVASPSFAQGAEEDEAAPTFAEDLDTFWAEQRRVRVLQRRLYETSGEVQLTLYAGAVPNDPFLNYFPIGLRLGYHLSEQIALELSGSYNIRSRSELEEVLEEDENLSVFVRDIQQWRANLAILWSPIYGKFSFAGTKLAHFDWYFGAGVGVLGAENPSEADLNTFETGIKPEVALITGWNLHLHQRWALRLDYRQFVFQKEDGGVAYPSEISLGASVFF